MIINPNASISLGAPLPSDPTKMAAYRLPLDPATQGVPQLDPAVAGIAFWVLTVHVLELRRQVDRLERLVLHALGESPPDHVLEVLGLGRELAGEIAQRREAAAKAAAELAGAGGVQ